MPGPWEKYQGGVVASMPGAGPKPPAGYGSPGAPPIAPLPGGPDDPRVIANIERMKAGIGAGKEMGVANYRTKLELQADAVKQARDLANAAAKAKLPPQMASGDVVATKNRIAALMALNNQVRRSAQQFDANFKGSRGDPSGGVLGRLAEHVPAFMNGTNDSFDATISGMAPLARAAFRTPGQGSDSDRDVSLFMGMVPSRHSTDAGNKQRYQQMNSMIVDNINNQRAILGQGPLKQTAKAKPEQPTQVPAKGAPVRIKGDADFDRLPSGSAFIGPDGKTRVKP